MKSNALIIKSLCFIGLIGTGSLFGQESELLTKDQAMAQMLSANFGIQMAQNEQLQAENNASLLNSGYLPGVALSSGASYDLQDQEVTFRDGSLNVVDGAETKRLNASLNLSYTIFDGMGRYYNYQRLKQAEKLSGLQVQATIESTLLQLFTVYFELARLTENQTVLQQVLNNTKDRLRRANYGFDYGQNTKLDVLNAEVDLVNDSIALNNNAQQLVNTRRDLAVLLNDDLNRDFRVDTAVVFLDPLTLDALQQKAPTENIRVLIGQSNKQLSAYSVKFQRSLELPRLGLTGAYGWNEGIFPATGFATKNISSGFSAGLQLSWNIFNGGANRTALKNSKISLENQELALEEIKVEVQRDVANAYGDLLNRKSAYGLLSRSIETAQNNYNRSLDRYRLGQLTSLELRQAQINLLNAKMNANMAKYQAKLSELTYLQTCGQLLNVPL
jgi:outer membrane protein